jgi:DNA-binding NarL/FixJ family response regulator
MMPHVPPLRAIIVAREFIIALDLQWILEHLGVEVSGLARDPRLGLRMASELLPDLALVDISFDLQGIELAKRLRDEHSTSVIFIGDHIKGRIAGQIERETTGSPVNRDQSLARTSSSN